MFEQTFKNIDDILHKDAGCGSELDYVEQTSWILFLKYLEDLEIDKATEAELKGKTYTPILNPEYQWSKHHGSRRRKKTPTRSSARTSSPKSSTNSACSTRRGRRKA